MLRPFQIQKSPMLTYTITDRILLAGQPAVEDWRQLYDAGYRLVINLRSDPERAAVQGRNAEAAGLTYIHAPLPAYLLEPEHLAEFAQMIESAPEGKICIHCRTATRVALLWMLYRVQHQGWTMEQARAELRAAGYDDSSMETFDFCAEDYFDRAGMAMPA